MSVPHPTPDFSELSDSQKMLIISLAINDMQSKLDKHHKLLITGNGEIPLTEQIRNLNYFVETLRFWAKTIALAILAQTVAFGSAVVIGYIRLLPILEKLANGQQP